MNSSLQNNFNYKKYEIDSNLKYFKPHSTKIEKTFAEEINYSLNKSKKFINPKFFYDKKGSDLFEQICKLPEYYPTRTELHILKNLKKELPNYLDYPYRLVELGSGASLKTRLILDVLSEIQKEVEYFPIDISEILTESSELLLRDFENLSITGIIDTYEGGLEFIEKYDDKKNLIIFLGSSYGNFTPDDGKEFLKKINETMKFDDLFLIGLDLVKDKEILEKAYDDSQGVTAKFNLNVLERINDELDADFNLKNFKHFSKYNEKDQRVEMYLQSLTNQSVIISKSNLSLELKQGEMIHTEHSHKYTVPQIKQILEISGFEINQIWLDEDEHYSLTLARKRSS